MSDFPSVCIMIPTYNQAGCITMAVDSALQQTYPNLKVVVADDNSTDNTSKILEQYIAEKKIQYVKNPTNLGRVANYQQCLYQHADADWVINLDGDDYFTNIHFISQAMQAIMQAGKDDVLFFQGMHIYKQGNSEKVFRTGVHKETLLLKAQDYFFNFQQLGHFSHMSTLYKRADALKSGFYEEDKISIDIYSLLKCALNNPEKKVILSNIVSGVWLQHNDNASKNLRPHTHWNNYLLYPKLYQIAILQGYGKMKCLQWLLSSFLQYVRGFAGSIWRQLKNKT